MEALGVRKQRSFKYIYYYSTNSVHFTSEDKAQHSNLARKFVSFTQFPVAVPNYRLTDSSVTEDRQLRHPAHAEDILQFLNFLLTWHGPDDQPLYNPNRIYLIGHSCSAHMLTSIFLNSSSITPTLTPSPSLLEAVKSGGIVMSEGIYDLPLLLSTFPSYKEWFIAPTFGECDSYLDVSTTRYPLWNTDINWLIVHSKADSLVDVTQSMAINDHLRSLYDAAGVSSDTRVICNLDELEEEHNAMLRRDHYVRIIGEYILRSSGSELPVLPK
jgi:hypothetical protein